jgi:hypothetical protein
MDTHRSGLRDPGRGSHGRGIDPEVDPLNFSGIGYDLTGAQVHADSEIWAATNLDVREASTSPASAPSASTAST